MTISEEAEISRWRCVQRLWRLDVEPRQTRPCHLRRSRNLAFNPQGVALVTDETKVLPMLCAYRRWPLPPSPPPHDATSLFHWNPVEDPTIYSTDPITCMHSASVFLPRAPADMLQQSIQINKPSLHQSVRGWNHNISWIFDLTDFVLFIYFCFFK